MDSGEAPCGGEGQISPTGFRYDGGGQGVLGGALQAGGQGEKPRLVVSIRRKNVRHPGLALGDGARLVQSHDLDFARLFQRDGGLEQDAVFSAHAAAHHDGHRRGQAQGAGTADDQYGDAPGQGEARALPQQQPHGGGNDGDRDDRRDEYPRYLVGHLGDGGLGGGGVADHADDLGEGGVLSHAGGLTFEKTGLVQGGGRDGVPRRLVHRDALAGEGGLVHRAGSLQHHAVYRDGLSGADHKDVLLADLFHGDHGLRPVPDHGGGLRGQLHQALESVGGFSLAAGLQHFAHGDEGEDHGGRLKVELVHIGHDGVHIAPHLGAGHGKEGVGAVHEGRRGTQSHQRVHIGGAAPQAPEAGDKEFLVDDHDGHGEQELGQAHGHMVAVKKGGQRPAPHHVAHGEVHQHQQEAQGRDETALERRGLPVPQGRPGLRRGGCPTVTPGRPLLGGAVARALHRSDDGLGGGGSLHSHGVGEQAHGAGGDAGDFGHGFFHPGAAGGAAHARYVVLFHTGHTPTISSVFAGWPPARR